MAVVFTLHAAQTVLIPVTLGILLTYALSPAVDFLRRWHVPRGLGAALILLGLLGSTISLGYYLQDDAVALVKSLPEKAQELRRKVQRSGWYSPGVLQDIQRAATNIEQTAIDSSGVRQAPRKGVTRVQIDDGSWDIGEFFWSSTFGVLTVSGQAALMLLLIYFLLLSNDTYRRKLVRIAGPTLAAKRVTGEILDEIGYRVQRFLLVQLATSTAVGLLSWLMFRWLGLENAALWGFVAGLFNLIPYLGALLVAVATAAVALLQFGEIGMALLVGGLSLLITSLEGYLITPWLLSRAGKINAVAMFISLLFWGWLWGAWGVLLGPPIMFVAKTICDHVDGLKSVGELLGDSS